jgi:AcrR family transcriptional regulator
MKALQKDSKAAPFSKPTKPVTPSGKEQLIWKAYQVFREKGYHYTTMADIGKASGLLKGSIYHYFESKEELMKQVLQTAHEKFKEDVFAIAYQDGIPAKACLQGMLEKMEVYFFELPGGCLMGNIGLETAGREMSFTPVIHAFFEEWTQVFAHLFRSQYGIEQCEQLAKQSVSDLQGAIMLACICKDKNYFCLTVKKIMQILS